MFIVKAYHKHCSLERKALVFPHGKARGGHFGAVDKLGVSKDRVLKDLDLLLFLPVLTQDSC